MSTKITPVQLNANTKIYGVDDYREMVNYTSGTNKGYVRFTKASDGKLKLEKFNNKIDVPLSLRSNTSAVHNRAVRAKFLSALNHDLMYMDEPGKKKIEDMIIRPLKPDASGINAGKALSRRDVKAVLDEFDKIQHDPRPAAHTGQLLQCGDEELRLHGRPGDVQARLHEARRERTRRCRPR